jgi:membrane protein DedA with SNARE-associated domain
MSDLTQLIGQWGYLAIFLLVILGNIGVPVPEEAIMVLAGLLVWEKKLWFPAVVIVGFVGAVVGDNFGYWAGRRYGRALIKCYGQRLFITSERLDWIQRFVKRYGSIAVFLARFVPGMRFMAGPLGGIASMPFPRFFLANIAGAAIYVPLVVACGYGIGLGFGQYLYELERFGTEVEHIVLWAIFIGTFASLAWRIFNYKRSQRNER